MSIYRQMFGVNQSTFWILPMLDKHPDDFPRFRDCFVKDTRFKTHNCDSPNCEYEGLPVPTEINPNEDMNNIYVLLRIGGDNRKMFQKEIEELRNMPTYVKDYDDDLDNTYATFVFDVPKEWKKDWAFFKYAEGCTQEEHDELGIGVTEEYKKQLYKIFPNKKKEFEELFIQHPV